MTVHNTISMPAIARSPAASVFFSSFARRVISVAIAMTGSASVA